MVVDSPARERDENSYISARILTALESMTSRMDRLKMSQMQIDENERQRGSIDSGLFDSALGRGIGRGLMSCEALGFMPLRRSPEPPASPPPRLRAPAMGQSLVEPLSLRVSPLPPQQQQASVMQQGYAQQALAIQQAYAQKAYATMQQRAAPAPVDAPAPVLQGYQKPDARQRKLAIRKFDCSELYQGLGAGFQDWRRLFIRAVNFS